MTHTGHRGAVPSPLLLVLAAVAAVEAVAFAVHAVVVVVEGWRAGASLQGLVIEGAVFGVFAFGLAAAARGWWLARRWARSLHVLAQLLVLVVAAPLAQSADSLPRLIGIVGVVIAAPSLILAMTPPVTRAIVPPDELP